MVPVYRSYTATASAPFQCAASRQPTLALAVQPRVPQLCVHRENDASELDSLAAVLKDPGALHTIPSTLISVCRGQRRVRQVPDRGVLLREPRCVAPALGLQSMLPLYTAFIRAVDAYRDKMQQLQQQASLSTSLLNTESFAGSSSCHSRHSRLVGCRCWCCARSSRSVGWSASLD